MQSFPIGVTAPDVSVDLREPVGYTVATQYRLAPGKGGYRIWQAKNTISYYARLSQEDERQSESNSIHNQKLFLERYATNNGFDNALFLADDGYSGTNFDQPAWKKIVEMIENGEVETLIVKDLSRMGREYLQVGQLTELYGDRAG